MAEPRHAATPTRRPAPGNLPLPTRIPARVPAAVLGMLAFGLLLVLAAAVRVDWTLTNRFNPLDGARNFTPTPLPMATASDLEQPEVTTLAWAGPVFAVLVVAAAAVLVAMLVRKLWRARPQRRVQPSAESPALPAGAVSVEAQAEALRRGALTALEILDETGRPGGRRDPLLVGVGAGRRVVGCPAPTRRQSDRVRARSAGEHRCRRRSGPDVVAPLPPGAVLQPPGRH